MLCRKRMEIHAIDWEYSKMCRRNYFETIFDPFFICFTFYILISHDAYSVLLQCEIELFYLYKVSCPFFFGITHHSVKSISFRCPIFFSNNFLLFSTNQPGSQLVYLASLYYFLLCGLHGRPDSQEAWFWLNADNVLKAWYLCK